MNIIIEAFFICLLTSMIWAPIVFLLANRLTKGKDGVFADKLWPAALIISALPAMFAPVAAALGLSLRSNAPLPPMAAFEAPVSVTPTIPTATIANPSNTLDIGAVFEAAAVLYFYGFLMFLALGVIRMIWFSYRVHYAFDIDNPRLEAGLDEWRKRMNVKRRPRYAFSDAVSSVCVHGLFRPVILMPMNLLDRVSLNDAILMGAHEMAHIKRGDTRLFALCTAARAVFWFNPFMQRIAACANLAAEQAADALVIARGAERRQYAQCFVQGLRFAAGASNLGRDLVPSFTPFDKRSRRERLNAILSNTREGPLLSLTHKISLVLSVMAAAVIAFAQAAFAVAPSPAQQALPASPVEGEITLSFGQRRGVLGRDRPTHEGVDIKAIRGSLVRAAGDGKVIDATRRYRGQPAWGKVVVIDHGHGLVTRYAHLDSYLVKKGDAVDAGDVIGAVGSTGKATGPHLHFEVIQDGLPIDPAPVLAAEPMSAPTPLVAAAVEAAVAAPTPVPAVKPSTRLTLRTQIEQNLGGRLKTIEVKMANAFDGIEIDDLEGFEFEFGDVSIESVEDFKTFAMNGIGELQSWEFLTEDDREAWSEAQREAAQAARDALREAQKEISRATRDRAKAQRDTERAAERSLRDRERSLRDQERAERDAERAERERERVARDAERAERDAERAREKAEREFERAIKRAEAQAERELERAEREWERSAGESIQMDEQEVLELQEKALMEAQADIEKQLNEIKRRRADLKRQKRKSKND
ncbi:MAG: peptidoglycan DD-metalloendopeptidase family protein [Pseudomonadota bacterium]